MKVVEKYSDGDAFNYRMENGDFNSFTWNGFGGIGSTVVMFWHGEEMAYDVYLEKECISHDDAGMNCEVRCMFYKKGDGINCLKDETVKITWNQYLRPSGAVYFKKILDAFYKEA